MFMVHVVDLKNINVICLALCDNVTTFDLIKTCFFLKNPIFKEMQKQNSHTTR